MKIEEPFGNFFLTLWVHVNRLEGMIFICLISICRYARLATIFMYVFVVISKVPLRMVEIA